MGTRITRLTLTLGLVCMGVSSWAWADTAAPAPPASATPIVVAQAAPEAPQAATEPEPELLLGVTQNARGTVYYCDDRHWEAWSTVGSTAGLRPNAQVEFVRKGKVVATGKVKTVKASDCIVTPDKGTPAGTILKGDQVRIVVNGTRADLDRVIKRERRLDDMGTIGLTALLAGCIIAAR
jgi:hypothetical protein